MNEDEFQEKLAGIKLSYEHKMLSYERYMALINDYQSQYICSLKKEMEETDKALYDACKMLFSFVVDCPLGDVSLSHPYGGNERCDDCPINCDTIPPEITEGEFMTIMGDNSIPCWIDYFMRVGDIPNPKCVTGTKECAEKQQIRMKR